MWRARRFLLRFYAYGCFNHIKTVAAENRVEDLPPVYLLAICYFFLSLVCWGMSFFQR